MASIDLKEELNCSVCLGIYADPIMLSCGHNFCKICIERVFEECDVYTCPECRASFLERPILHKNLKLRNIVERLKSAESDRDEAGILCTYCESHVPAAKTCLHCDASLCINHLRRHSQSAEHVLTAPTTAMGNRKCLVHKKILEYYCTEDDTCICVACCLAGEHKGHQIELINEAFQKKKEELTNILEKLYLKGEEAKTRICYIQEHEKEVDEKVDGITDRVTALFRDIRENLQVLENQVLCEIIRQKKKISLSVSDLIQQLEKKRDELSTVMLPIKKMCAITDPVTFLREKLENNDICLLNSDGDSDVNVAGHLDEAPVSLILHIGLLNFADTVMDLKAMRLFHVLETSDIVLDVQTASNNIVISRDLKSASYTATDQRRPDLPERFKTSQVLSKCSFSTGQHFWEVDVSKAKEWIVGVACQSIERKIVGNESFMGYNDKSWGLYFQNHIGASHNNIQTHIDIAAPMQSVGIYLNYEAGQLSFYQMSFPLRHLHTFNATFTEPLYPAFFLFEECSIRVKKYNDIL
ncbi:E3 ubiquitin/ISG15 ligase TRIM25-like [Rhinophrynus dorsalis]